MAIQNLANYQIGKSYKLDIKDLGILDVVVKGKGNHKLELRFTDGAGGWFTNDQLSSVKSQPKKKVVGTVLKTVKVETPIVAQVAKVLASKNPTSIQKPVDVLKTSRFDIEKDLEDENITDYTYLIRSVKRDLRTLLQNRGYNVSAATRFSILLKLVQDNLNICKRR